MYYTIGNENGTPEDNVSLIIYISHIHVRGKRFKDRIRIANYVFRIASTTLQVLLIPFSIYISSQWREFLMTFSTDD